MIIYVRVIQNLMLDKSGKSRHTRVNNIIILYLLSHKLIYMKIRKPFLWVLISFYTQISCNSSKSSEIVILSKEEQLKEIN